MMKPSYFVSERVRLRGSATATVDGKLAVSAELTFMIG